MFLEGLANLYGSLIVEQIIVAVAHAQAILGHLHGVHVAVHLVGTYINGQVGSDAFLVHLGQQRVKLFLVFQGGNLVEFGLDGSYAFLIQLDAVHGNLIHVAHFLCDRACLVLRSGQFFDKALNLLAVVFGQNGERAILRILVGQRIVLDPTAAGIAVEVRTRQVGCVQVGKVDAGGQNRLLLACVAGCQCQAKGCNGEIILQIHNLYCLKVYIFLLIFWLPPVRSKRRPILPSRGRAAASTSGAVRRATCPKLLQA